MDKGSAQTGSTYPSRHGLAIIFFYGTTDNVFKCTSEGIPTRCKRATYEARTLSMGTYQWLVSPDLTLWPPKLLQRNAK